MIRRAATIGLALLLIMVLPAAAMAVGPGTISGKVTPVAIAPEVEVCVVEAQPSELCTAPEASGAYRLRNVPLGPLRVEFLPSYRSGYLNQYYDHRARLAEASVIEIPSQHPELREIDADLKRGSTIEGTVTAAPGAGPLEGVEVCAQEAGTRASVGCAESGESGRYALSGLPGGGYKVGFWGYGRTADYLSTFYGGTSSFDGATSITVPAQSVVSGIDAELEKGARIEGTVTAAGGGGGISDVPVCLFPVAALAPAQCVLSGSFGLYAMVGIASGDYQVAFAPAASEMGGETAPAPGGPYLTQYYQGAASRGESRTLSLAPAQALPDIDAALASVPVAAPTTPPTLAPAPAPVFTPVQFPPEPTKRRRKCGRAGGGKGTRAGAKCAKHRKRTRRKHSRHRRRHGHSRHRGRHKHPHA